MKIKEFNPNSRNDRENFLYYYKDSTLKNSYPDPKIDLIFDTLKAEYVRDKTKKNNKEYSERIGKLINKAMSPVSTIAEVKEYENENEISDEQFLVLYTTNFFRESLSSFTVKEEETIHGGDIANQFILSNNYDKSLKNLREFKEWYKQDLNNLLSRLDSTVNLRSKEYKKDNLYNILLFNGLRILLDRRHKGEEVRDLEKSKP